MDLLFADIGKNQLWHLFPLLIVISLVYGATRHELAGPILANAIRFGVWMLGFIAVVFVVLLLISSTL